MNSYLRQTILIVLIFIFAFLLGCRDIFDDSNQRARDEWKKHELVLIQISHHERISLDKFEEATDFFQELTGISVLGDHSPDFDWYPTEKTGQSLVPLRAWYQTHKDALYWDKTTHKVVLR